MIPIRPIFSSLSRHKAATAILLIEIALTCAILCNAFDLIAQRLDNINTPTGIDEQQLIQLVSPTLSPSDDAWPKTQTDLAILRSIPDVESVAATNQVPLTQSSTNSGIGLSEDPNSYVLNATQYFGDNSLLETLGLRLVAGRMFTPEEILPMHSMADFNVYRPKGVIISEKMAIKLFPDGSALGKNIYMGTEPAPVIGIVEYLIRPSGGSGERKHWSMILPAEFSAAMGGHYLLRTKPGTHQHNIIELAKKALKKDDPKRVIIEAETFPDMRQDYYANEQSMAKLLSLVSIILLVVTAFGIVGLASFWVQQRTKQIGVRRALGATKTDVLRYFQTENFLIVSAGIVLGMLLAFGINQLLMDRYELSRLPLIYLPMGALVLWVLGQIAVYWPARKAANIPPATATRSV